MMYERGQEIPEAYFDCVLATEYPKRIFTRDEWERVKLVDLGGLFASLSPSRDAKQR
jgi:hypothetical protein